MFLCEKESQPRNFFEDTMGFFDTSDTGDLIFQSEGKNIHLHSQFIRNSPEIVELAGLEKHLKIPYSEKTTRELVYYLYKGEVRINDCKELKLLFQVAMEYKLEHLKNSIVKELANEIKTSNVIELLEFAIAHELQILMDACSFFMLW